ncbi:MAG: ParA family protein [Coriobacteriales bacterium]|nr:ParA family protein [Coriobacteriales bacterium]
MNYKDTERSNEGETLVLAVINQKGGVGKSTTAINLSACLGELGKKTLVVDLDPQGNTTSGYGIRKNKISNCIYDAMLHDVPVEDIIQDVDAENVWLIPATIQLTGAEIELVSQMSRESRLADVITPIKDYFDYVLIDCPPSLGLLTINALTAANKLLIPIQCEFYALEGVTKLLDSMKLVKARLNPSLDVFGVVMTMYDGRTTLARQVIEEVRNFFGDKVFDTYIPRTVKLSEAPGYGEPIIKYTPNGKGAKAYRELATEVIACG